jgi:RNA polymerase sigma factor (sigma-70 family)
VEQVDPLDALVPGLFRFALAVSGDRAGAEDLVTEAMARALPRLRRGAVDDPGAYLRRAVVNQMTSGLRRRRVERRHAHHAPVTAARDRPGGEGAVDDRLALLPHLDALPVGQRAVLVLRFLEDRSVDEVAALLGVAPGTVKAQTSRGLDRLRRSLEEEDVRG